MVQAAVILGFLAGLVTRGRLRNLVEHKLYWLPALFSSFACEAVVFTGVLYWLAGESNHYETIRMSAGFLQYALVLIFLIRNLTPLRPAYVKLALISLIVGSFGNGLVILANRGQMPIALEAVQQFGPNALQKIESAHHYMIAVDHTPLRFLGDWIPVWSLGWYMVSPGDFFIAVGLFLFAFWLTRPGLGQKVKTVEHPDEIVYTNGR